MIHPAPSPGTTRRSPAKKEHAQGVIAHYSSTCAIAGGLARGSPALSCLPLWKNATRTVFGEGRATAHIIVIGEQPGDREDLTGKPFVGPAGKLLDRALKQAGVARTQTYVTNAVEHFKFEPRGKRRIHKKPNEREISVCQQHWLDNELRAITPPLVIAMGATASLTHQSNAAQASRCPISSDESPRARWCWSERRRCRWGSSGRATPVTEAASRRHRHRAYRAGF